MLVLTRKFGEKIVIQYADGKEVIIQYVELKGNSVRLGIDAPQDVKIWREELYHKEMEDRRRNVDPPEDQNDAQP